MMRKKAHRLVETQGPDQRHTACCILKTAQHVGCGSPPTPRREAPGSGGETPPLLPLLFLFSLPGVPSQKLAVRVIALLPAQSAPTVILTEVSNANEVEGSRDLGSLLRSLARLREFWMGLRPTPRGLKIACHRLP